MPKKGVLLINVGTPDEPSVESVKEYLREFLLDPDVIDAPAPIRHLLVRGIILRTRPKKIAPRYQSIWMEGDSPLRIYTQRIAKSLQENTEEIVFEVGMRYGNPSVKHGLEKLKNEGVNELLLAPLFPHYAQATTESSLKHAHNQLKEMGWAPNIMELPPFPDSPEFIRPLSESIKPFLGDDVHLLFSYHGLPMSHIRRAIKLGKPNYAEHCKMTTESVVNYLGLDNNQWSLSYQSRLGPVKWLTPSTSKTVTELAKIGKKKLVIVSPAFLADGLETLEELDIEIREIFYNNGGEDLTVVKCLNDNKSWIKEFSTLILDSFNNSTRLNF